MTSINTQLSMAFEKFLTTVDKLSDVTVIETSTYCHLAIGDRSISSWCPTHSNKTPCKHSGIPSMLLNDLVHNQGALINEERKRLGAEQYDFSQVKSLNITFSHRGQNDCIYSYNIQSNTLQPVFDRLHCADCDKIFGITSKK